MNARARAGASVVGAVLGAALLTGCAGAPEGPADAPPRAPAPSAPAWHPGVTTEIGAAPVEVDTAEVGRFAAMVPPPAIDDPSLVVARDLVQRGKRLDAAREIEAMASTPASEGPDRAVAARRWLLAATLRRDGGDAAGAITSYERAASLAPGLAPACGLEIAELQLALGRYEAASRTVASIPEADRTSDAWPLVEAEVDVRAGDASRGAATLIAMLEAPRRAPGWATSALRLARALVAKPGEPRAEAAVRVARFIVANGSGPTVAEAHALEKRALDTLPRAARQRLAGSAFAEKVESARAKLRSKDARAAVTALDRLAKGEAKRARGADACAFHRVRGEALGDVKRKAEAADAYGLAIEACVDAPDRLDVIFAAAKASQRAERAVEAEARFARVEAEGPTSRLADDARAARVQAALDHGDVATATSLAQSAWSTYPTGDVVLDAPFALALAHMVEGRWGAARASLEAIAPRGGRERSYPRAGRFDYFLGRARESGGDRAGARLAYTQLVRARPATYYGALAHARLEEIEPGAGARALDEAAARARSSPALPEPTDEELASGALRRAIELAVVGDPAGAEAELAGRGPRSKPPSPGLRWWLVKLVAPSDPLRASALLRGSTEVELGPTDVDFDAWIDVGPFAGALPAWKIAYPRPFAVEVAAASSESAIAESLVLSIMREESAFSPSALSRTGARGLLQLMPATARKMATPLGLPHDDEALQRPEINTRLGARFLGQLRQRFPHAPLLAVPSYNAGPLAIEKWCEERSALDFDLWVETIPYRETRLYTKRVLASLAAYDLLGPGRARGEVFFTPRRACVDRAAGAAEDVDRAEPADATTSSP